MRQRLRSFLLAGLWLFMAGRSVADEFSSWEWLSPKPAGSYLTKITFDGTRFIGVGDMGVILTSTNGTNWNLAYTDTTNRMFGITIGGGRLLAHGAYGTLLVSTNAEVWTRVPIAATGTIDAVVHGLDRYVLFDYIRLFVSTNATDWREHPSGLTNRVNDLAFWDDFFVAVGSGGLVATSTNSLDWVSRESGTVGSLWSVAHGDGKWVAVGGETNVGIILTSPDAINWSLQITDRPLYEVAFGEFGFLVTGEGSLTGPGFSMLSKDGVYFSGGEPGDSGLDALARGVACGNGVCVAVGNHGRIWSTTDGTNWISQTDAPVVFPNSFASDGQRLVAVGSKGAILVSEDGLAFTNRAVVTNEFLSRVIHTGQRFIAIGGRGVIRTSVDGIDWPLENIGTDATLRDVAFGNGATVAIGSDATGRPYGLFVTRDLYGDWQIVRPAPNEYLNSRIAFGNGRFVAAGYNGEIWTSLDGLAWEKLNLGTGQTMLPIQFLNGRFMGFTANSLATSDDGLNWTFTPGNPPTARQITHGNGLYLVTGDTWGGLHTSEDAIHWAYRPMKTLSLVSGTYFKDSFYVSGFILKSRSSLIPEIQKFQRTGGSLNFELFGKIGRDYELQSSTNLVTWQHEHDYTQPVRVHQLNRPVGADQRFYRVKLKEP